MIGTKSDQKCSPVSPNIPAFVLTTCDSRDCGPTNRWTGARAARRVSRGFRVNQVRARSVNSAVVRLTIISFAVLCSVAIVHGQQLVPCVEYTSPYRDLGSEAITKVPASFPAERGMRVKSQVLILVKVDRAGHVISARAVCGHPLLVATSVASARKWTFRPRRVRGKRVNFVGTISFEFGLDSSSSSTLETTTAHNKSLDASRGSVFLMKLE